MRLPKPPWFHAPLEMYRAHVGGLHVRATAVLQMLGYGLALGKSVCFGGPFCATFADDAIIDHIAGSPLQTRILKLSQWRHAGIIEIPTWKSF